ncbi:Sjogren's syndrome/scleroderma autoantigen 1 family protein [Halobiforma nitratireducens]|uniref:Sjogrens syndrome scleroderma autoantigen 1 n=1 Tax=Halobiforma nitratireducens JCM 10879 TaxID=1227454 RepID=M0LBK7_9EURY|nr:Sjogren's syndrome/scleroderma autoantigen 1 family protein [Halobiforma nitratireducens]EMA29350.1 hypothetical protein C446_17374 [Halobiforma nitratireducens JCM 10879]
MSDFDKEAEREKLREKYERDKAEREATQRMSDLLLKGATMTNAHCGTCGDPLFKENGVTFCPSCHGNAEAVQGTDLEARPAEESTAADSGEDARADADGNAASSDGADPTAPTDAASSGDEPEDGSERAVDRARARADPSQSRSRSRDDPTGPTRSAPTDPTDSTTEPDDPSSPATAEAARRRADAGESAHTPPSQRRGAADHDPEPSPSRRSDRQSGTVDTTANASVDAGGEFGDARESLQHALERFAAEAATTDDPRYATECLEAAREASETLNTLR